MPKSNNARRAHALMNELWEDMNDRRGFRANDQCDSATIREWRAKWRCIIERHLDENESEEDV